jgi:hypothetical protein
LAIGRDKEQREVVVRVDVEQTDDPRAVDGGPARVVRSVTTQDCGRLREAVEHRATFFRLVGRDETVEHGAHQRTGFVGFVAAEWAAKDGECWNHGCRRIAENGNC